MQDFIGMVLHFDFIKACIVILLVLFVTSGDYNILTNIQYGKYCEEGNVAPDGVKCVRTWVRF
jgi:hypothetical protein